MKRQTYESRSAAHPSFLIEVGVDPDYEYCFSGDLDEWHDEAHMQQMANMLVKTFDLGCVGHKFGHYTLAQIGHELRVLLDVPIGHGLLVRSRGRWSWYGPIYDEKGDLVPRETMS